MRKIDKKLNIQKANLLTEQRYLIENSLSGGKPKIIWKGGTKQIKPGLIINSGDEGEYLGREGGEDIVSFNGMNFYTPEWTFYYVNDGVVGDDEKIARNGSIVKGNGF